MRYSIYPMVQPLEHTTIASQRAEEYRDAAQRLTALVANYRDPQVVATLMTVVGEFRQCAERWTQDLQDRQQETRR